MLPRDQIGQAQHGLHGVGTDRGHAAHSSAYWRAASRSAAWNWAPGWPMRRR